MSVYYNRPVLSEKYQYGETECNELTKTMSVLSYVYFVDKRKYIRETYFNEDQSLDKSKYYVKYRIDEPKIGYLISK